MTPRNARQALPISITCADIPGGTGARFAVRPRIKFRRPGFISVAPRTGRPVDLLVHPDRESVPADDADRQRRHD